MAKKKATEETSPLVAAAKKIGEVAGKVAPAVGVAATPPKPKTGKLQKKTDKTKLPRRQKKAAKKAAAKLA